MAQARFLIEDRSTIPDDGQADPTLARAGDLDDALAKARELARDAARTHGRGRGIVYVYEDGTNQVWSVAYHPEPGVEVREAVLDDEGRQELGEFGEPLFRIVYRYPVGWRIVHDPTEQVVAWDATDEAGRAVISAKSWTGQITVTDLDEDGNPIAVDDAATGATRDVSHVEVARADVA